MAISSSGSDLPDPVADDAPTTDQFEDGAEYRRPGSHLTDLIAVQHDGEVFCYECANPEYVELCRESPRSIPSGGPVDRGAESDCPAPVCGHCLRRLADYSVIHREDCRHNLPGRDA